MPVPACQGPYSMTLVIADGGPTSSCSCSRPSHSPACWVCRSWHGLSAGPTAGRASRSSGRLLPSCWQRDGSGGECSIPGEPHDRSCCTTRSSVWRRQPELWPHGVGDGPVRDSDLIAALGANDRTSALRATARPSRTPVTHNDDVIADDQADRIELELTTNGYVASVVRRAPDGSATWRLNPPEDGQDAFVKVELRPDELVVISWSGWRVATDPVSGAETQRDFTK